MLTKPSKSNVTQDPSIFDRMENKILGYGKIFPENPPDKFVFTLTTKERRQQFIYDAANEVWQEIGNDSLHGLGNIDMIPPIVPPVTPPDDPPIEEPFSDMLVFVAVDEIINHSLYANTQNVPQFYDISYTGLGPYANDVEIIANGTADDQLFIFEGSDPSIYPPVDLNAGQQQPYQTDVGYVWRWYYGNGITSSYSNEKLCEIPAGKVFSVMLVDTCQTNVIWDGSITIRSLKNTVNLKDAVSEQYQTSHPDFASWRYILTDMTNNNTIYDGGYNNLPQIDLTGNNRYQLTVQSNWS